MYHRDSSTELNFLRQSTKRNISPRQKFRPVASSMLQKTLIFLTLLQTTRSSPSPNGTTTISPYERCVLEIGCQCFELDEITGVMCDNLTDVGLFTRKLGDGSIFEPSPPETYEITLTGIRIVPPNVIQGLMVFHLILDDPMIETVSDEAFDGVQRLRRFRIRASSVHKLPNFNKVVHSLRNVNIDNSLITAVGQELRNFNLLEEVSFRNNSITTIAEDAFIGLPVLRTLDFSHNRLTFLPSHLLDDLPSLRMLTLSYNQLHSVNGLLTVARPRFILLDHNNLTNADEILHENMTGVETVQLNNNPLGKLSESTFNTRVPNMRFIYLAFCGLREFNVRHFWNLSDLSFISAPSNLIEHVPEQLIDFGENLQIELSDNLISTFKATMTSAIRRLYMSGNRMKHLGTMFQFTKLDEVDVNRNHLEAITELNFKGMTTTGNLALRENLISSIDTEAFASLRNDLLNLDLSSNKLQSLNGSIRLLSRLKSLNISNNNIEVMREGEFLGLNELADLYLQFNKIVALPGELQRMPQLQYLIIQHNAITTMNIQQLPKSLKFLYFNDNPIACNCKFLPFLQWLKNSELPQTDASYCENGSRLDTDTKGVILPNARICPQSCSCFCSQDANDTFVSVDCSSRNIIGAPDVFRNGVDSSKGFFKTASPVMMMENTDPRFIISDRILAVNLEDNRIASLEDWTFPSDLKVLRLAYNQLRRIPSSIMSLRVLRRISLSNNPWTCDCESMSFSKWFLSKMNAVVDVNNTRCALNGESDALSEKLLTDLSDVDLCPVYTSLYITVAFCLLSLLLMVAALIILYTHYDHDIKVWLYAHGVSCVKDKDEDQEKIFDAFISFSHKDDNFVIEKIITEVEDRLPNIRLCLHYRNFPPGEFIHNNIINAVRCSKLTVLVLSRNFLESEWCLLEFRAAHLQAFEDKLHKIIALRVGEMPETMDPAIKAHLDKITYITWGEKYFWQKFLYALPTPSIPEKRELCTYAVVPERQSEIQLCEC